MILMISLFTTIAWASTLSGAQPLVINSPPAEDLFPTAEIVTQEATKTLPSKTSDSCKDGALNQPSIERVEKNPQTKSPEDPAGQK